MAIKTDLRAGLGLAEQTLKTAAIMNVMAGGAFNTVVSAAAIAEKRQRVGGAGVTLRARRLPGLNMRPCKTDRMIVR